MATIQVNEEPSIRCGPVRVSKRAVWRASVLLAVQLAMVAHYVHWKAAGTTVTPVEPSESMQTLETGLINAGFLLFALLILSTLIFGRFFCGWGCHVVAYQDFCGWLLKRVGLRPKPFRSRLLVWVPAFTAFYMFVLPTLTRWIEGSPFPGLKWHLMTDKFWATFPSFWIGALTFVVCGFVIVYFMGNKGFCTYGCPYGALFYNADRFARGKIRVTDACSHCGHCTTACTSNVRVHEEVKHYGMVVDAGCMKCFDCISVCPTNALYYGFGKTAVAKQKIKMARLPHEQLSKRVYDFGWPEEIAMAAVFAISFYAFRGLYAVLPLLLAIGMSAVAAYLVLEFARLFYAPNVRVQKWQLRTKGKLTKAGKLALIPGLLLLVFVAHSAAWQYHFHEANRLYADAERFGSDDSKQREAEAAASAALARYSWCRQYGLFQTAVVEARIGTAYAFLGDDAKAIDYLGRAMDLSPDLSAARYQYARTLAKSGRIPESIEQLKIAFETQSDVPGLARDYAIALAGLGQPDEAVAAFRKALVQNPADVDSRIAFGLLLSQTGDVASGERELRKAIGQAPKSALAHHNLGLVLAERSQMHDALRELQEAVRLDPKFDGARVNLARVAAADGNLGLANEQFELLLAKDPYRPDVLQVWAEVQVRFGNVNDLKAKILATPQTNVAAWYRLVFFYRAEGQSASGDALYHTLLKRKADLPNPGP